MKLYGGVMAGVQKPDCTWVLFVLLLLYVRLLLLFPWVLVASRLSFILVAAMPCGCSGSLGEPILWSFRFSVAVGLVMASCAIIQCGVMSARLPRPAPSDGLVGV